MVESYRDNAFDKAQQAHIVLLAGGSACGKSTFGEALCMRAECPRVYIATMKPYGAEELAKIDKHRKQRADKGFTTIECYGALEKLRVSEGSVVLLECLGNLLSDECYDERAGWQDAYAAVKRIERGVDTLAAQCSQLVIVTNDVGSDGIGYPAPTDEYVRALGTLNCRIAAKADAVFDFAAGIPTMVKG
ncbi:MAG: bifunctional adenosylcobinamide kinase/adenosylcobinamide-phosphate guanylyltransferase [Eggerthellaceae bacterium]|nr:bifunctional adenosylcobinamide kinase/adenosylcobinamide-phosphate guanylyltransferase [Eggerthellaceae bacterium]